MRPNSFNGGLKKLFAKKFGNVVSVRKKKVLRPRKVFSALPVQNRPKNVFYGASLKSNNLKIRYLHTCFYALKLSSSAQ